jgi:hypothetical protein
MYKADVDGTTLFRETYTKRNEGGFATGDASIQYHFGDAFDKSTFKTLKEAVKYIRQSK